DDPREVVAQEVADVGRDLPGRGRGRHQALGRRHEGPHGGAGVDSVGAELGRNLGIVRLREVGGHAPEGIARQGPRALRCVRGRGVLVRRRTEPVAAVQGRRVRSEDVLEGHNRLGRPQVGAAHLVAVVVQRQDLDGDGGRRGARRGRRRGAGGGRGRGGRGRRGGGGGRRRGGRGRGCAGGGRPRGGRGAGRRVGGALRCGRGR